MLYRILADSVLLFHLAFVVFVVLGGLAVLRWHVVLWLHLPAALWGVLVQLGGWTCPLTPLENRLRVLGGLAGYSGGFVEQYLLSVLYPEGLTRDIQLALGMGVLLLNLIVYVGLVRQSPRAETRGSPAAARSGGGEIPTAVGAGLTGRSRPSFSA